MILPEYQVYEMTIGQSSNSPRQVYGVSRMVECDCPDCKVGAHRMDAFNRGTDRGWHKTREEAEAAIARASRR